MEKKSISETEMSPPAKDLNPKSASGAPGRDEMMVVKVVIGFLKYAGIAFLIWLAGWFGFRYMWIVMVIVVYTIWKKNKEKKNEKKGIVREVAEHEETALEAKLDQLPSWVRIDVYQCTTLYPSIYIQIELYFHISF